jgi:ABC-2 type transport system permease protein
MFSTMIQPIVWLAFMGNVFQLPEDVMIGFFGASTYLQFFAPTVVVMVAVFGGILNGYSIVIDVKKGFLKKMLVSPIARGAIASGKTLAASLKIGMQATIIAGIAIIMGVTVATGIAGFVAVVLIAMLLCFAFGGLSLAVAASAKNLEAHQAILNMLALPLIFLSPAISSFASMPPWLTAIAVFNPVTYAILCIRTLMINGWVWSVILPDLAIVGGFAILMIVLATALFRRSVS